MHKKFIYIFICFLSMCSITIQAEWEDRFGEHKTVYLSQILENPDSYLDVPVRIPLRFQSFRQVFTAFFSPYDRDMFLNFSAWDTLTPIWEKDGFLNDYPLFYVEKDNKELKSFLKLRRFDTVSVIAKVGTVFRGKPYFRVIYVCNMPGNLDVHNLSMLNRATTALKERKFDAALETFEKVIPTRPPEDIRAMIHKMKAKVFAYEKKDYAGAVRELKRGLKYAKNDGEMKALMKHCKYYMKHGGAAPQPIVKPPIVEESEEAEEKKSEEAEVPTEAGYEKKEEVKTAPEPEKAAEEYEVPGDSQPVEESVE